MSAWVTMAEHARGDEVPSEDGESCSDDLAEREEEGEEGGKSAWVTMAERVRGDGVRSGAGEAGFEAGRKGLRSVCVPIDLAFRVLMTMVSAGRTGRATGSAAGNAWFCWRKRCQATTREQRKKRA